MNDSISAFAVQQVHFYLQICDKIVNIGNRLLFNELDKKPRR